MMNAFLIPDCHHYSPACKESPCEGCEEIEYLNTIFRDPTPEQIANAPSWQDYKNAGFPGFKRQGK